MEIFTLLETIEEMLENSKSIPFSTKGIVDKEELLEVIKEIRLKLPEELKQAKWVKEERQRILVEAQKEAEAHAEEDKKKKDSVNAKNHLENTIYQAERMPSEYKDKISDEDKDAIKSAVEEAKKVLNDADADKDKFEEATKELNDKIMPIGAKLYQSASEDTKSDDSEKTGEKDDEPVEGEVVDK